jgi:hypothetical protein
MEVQPVKKVQSSMIPAIPNTFFFMNEPHVLFVKPFVGNSIFQDRRHRPARNPRVR